MANLKSSKKDIRRSEKRRAYSTSVKSALKTYIKKARKSVETESDSAQAVVRAVKALDKAVSSGIIHKNQAARRKSRLMKATNAAKSK